MLPEQVVVVLQWVTVCLVQPCPELDPLWCACPGSGAKDSGSRSTSPFLHPSL